MIPYLHDQFGNPGSLHQEGRIARKAVEKAREEVAAFINADPREIIFTGSGTEANCLAVRQIASSQSPHPTHTVLCSEFEHHSVLNPVRKGTGANQEQMPLLPVTPEGLINRDVLSQSIEKKPTLISVMLANNEVGTIQPINEIAQECHSHAVLIHSDAVQAAGKIHIDVQSLQVDALTLSAHKLHGPKGVGACFVRHGLSVGPLIEGGAQERRRRAGTENVAGIVGFAKACTLATQSLSKGWTETERLRDRMESSLLELVPQSWVNGVDTPRLPHLLNIAFEGLEGEGIMMALDAEGIAVGTGSACSSGSLDPSHVLLAMGQSHPQAHTAIRISLSHTTTQQDIERVIETLPALIARLRAT